MPKGTVLFSSRAPIGYMAIANGRVTTNQGFKSIIPFSNIGTPYVYSFLKNNLLLINNMASGSTFKEISGSVLKNIQAVVPDENSLNDFNSTSSPMIKLQHSLEKENNELKELRDTLLPKLISGEIDLDNFELNL